MDYKLLLIGKISYNAFMVMMCGLKLCQESNFSALKVCRVTE